MLSSIVVGAKLRRTELTVERFYICMPGRSYTHIRVPATDREIMRELITLADLLHLDVALAALTYNNTACEHCIGS